MKWMQRNIAALVVAGALSIGLAGPAAAQSTAGDGLVNVVVGDVTVTVPIVDAVNLVIEACDIDARVFAAVLGQIGAVDRSDRQRTFCTNEDGDNVVVTQN
jgi:hypothetical protein